ncbi:MAG: hypothetical protein JXA89_28475 [Anaerolineae bacterium]|nr:hypothetical protein [Anaerolineae bacterium]
MNRKWFVITLIAMLALLLSVGGATGQEPGSVQKTPPQGNVSIASIVGSRISYQGVLKENGSPVSGSRNMTFRLYSNSTCTTQVDSIVKSGVPVTNGLFSVELDVVHGFFDGRGLWLKVLVGGTSIVSCQEILPVPYALSLRPGAVIEGDYGVARIASHYSDLAEIYDSGLYGSANGNYASGVRGESDSFGVFGKSSAGYGVYGLSEASTSAIGVYGVAGNSTGNNNGVKGVSYSTNAGVAVAGINEGDRHAGWFETGDYVSMGVFNNSSGSAALQVSNSGTGMAAQFWGDVAIYGNLSKSSGGFKIDHPLDPENQYLNHSFVESPDMMNVYNGNVVLDANGEVWVELPDYFEALNRDFRYQLTSIGAPAPNLYIAEEISGNRFKVAGGPAGIQISWQVTGIRQDPWANAHRIPVEEEKPQIEQGLYLRPELYGRPESAAANVPATLDK